MQSKSIITNRWMMSISTLLIVLVAPILSGLALPPSVPNPGTTTTNPSSLGLTGDYNASSSINATKNAANLNGIKLDLTRQGGYYFYLYLENKATISLKLYSDQDLLSKGQLSLRLLDSKRKEVTRASTVTCPGSKPPCTVVLVARNQPVGAYYVRLDLPTGRGKSAWLSQVTQVGSTTLDGTSHTKAWSWYNQDDLYGQITATVSNHWYKVNLTPSKKYTFKLYGSSGSNLKMYVYSDANTSRPLASATASNYPQSLQVSVPGSAKFVYLRVENSRKTATEYFIQYTR